MVFQLCSFHCLPTFLLLPQAYRPPTPGFLLNLFPPYCFYVFFFSSMPFSLSYIASIPLHHLHDVLFDCSPSFLLFPVSSVSLLLMFQLTPYALGCVAPYILLLGVGISQLPLFFFCLSLLCTLNSIFFHVLHFFLFCSVIIFTLIPVFCVLYIVSSKFFISTTLSFHLILNFS